MFIGSCLRRVSVVAVLLVPSAGFAQTAAPAPPTAAPVGAPSSGSAAPSAATQAAVDQRIRTLQSQLRITEAQILAEVIGPNRPDLPPETAQSILSLKFSPGATKDIRRLLRKNNRGTITADERVVLEKYLRVGQFLDLPAEPAARPQGVENVDIAVRPLGPAGQVVTAQDYRFQGLEAVLVGAVADPEGPAVRSLWSRSGSSTRG